MGLAVGNSGGLAVKKEFTRKFEMPEKKQLPKNWEKALLAEARLNRKFLPNPDTMLDDLLALAADRWRGRGPRPAHITEKILATKRLKKAAAKIAAVEAANRLRKAKGRRKFYVPFGERAVDKAMVVMVPGEWHTAGDVARASGGEPAVVRDLEKKGLVERGELDKPVPWGGNRGFMNPLKWVYRLTELGEATREAVMLLRVVLVCVLVAWPGAGEAQERFHRVDGVSVHSDPRLLAEAERAFAACEGERAAAMLRGGLNAYSRQEAGWMVLRGCMARFGYVWR
jgi:hypothetical protein